mmetsp:Transcript_36098/g.44170  ORF Transcript_36098/g.44170 Transcript_36098/m.44170 type:complete len:98 (+) Transcript_36098:109-402(+)
MVTGADASTGKYLCCPQRRSLIVLAINRVHILYPTPCGDSNVDMSLQYDRIDPYYSRHCMSQRCTCHPRQQRTRVRMKQTNALRTEKVVAITRAISN